MNVPFHKPYFDNREIDAVIRSMKRNLIGFGPVVAAFEREFEAYIGASNAVAVNSCTAALHLALEVMGIGPGDEVITTSLTFCATVLAIIYTGATPVLADINPTSLCIDPASIRSKITPRTKAILPVHYAGRACNMDEIIDICTEHGLALIEDAAHGLPTQWKGKLIGSDNLQVKNAVCFSFHATKTLSIGDGGMITTSDPELAEKMRVKRLFGMKKNEHLGNGIDIALQFAIEDLGYKYNMTDLEASIGRVQLKKLDEMNQLRAEVALKYCEKLSDISEIILPSQESGSKTSWHLFVIRIKDNKNKNLRNSLLEYLGAKSIKASIHFIPIYRLPFFKEIFPKAEEELSNTEEVADGLLSLPMYPSMTDEELDYVTVEIRNFFRNASGGK